MSEDYLLISQPKVMEIRSTILFRVKISPDTGQSRWTISRMPHRFAFVKFISGSLIAHSQMRIASTMVPFSSVKQQAGGPIRQSDHQTTKPACPITPSHALENENGASLKALLEVSLSLTCHWASLHGLGKFRSWSKFNINATV